MKKGLLLLVLVFGGINMNAQTKIAHINSQELLDTLQSRKDAMAKLQKFEGEGVLELQEMNKSLEAAYIRYQQNEKDMTPVIQQMEQEKLQKKQQAYAGRAGAGADAVMPIGIDITSSATAATAWRAGPA